MATRTAQTRYNPTRGAAGRLRSNRNSNVNDTDWNLSQGKTIRSFKGDNKKATNSQRGEAAMARGTRNHTKQAYDIKRAFGVAVG